MELLPVERRRHNFNEVEQPWTEAVAVCEKGLRRQPDNLNSRAIRAAVYGYCGREREAREEAAEVLRINPKFTVASYTAILPYKNQSDRDFIAQGLRKAGLP